MKNLFIFILSVFCFLSCEKELTFEEQLYKDRGEWFCKFTFGSETHEVRSYGGNGTLFLGGDNYCFPKSWDAYAVYAEGEGEKGNIYDIGQRIELDVDFHHDGVVLNDFIGKHIENFDIKILQYNDNGNWEKVSGSVTVDKISDDFFYVLTTKQHTIEGSFEAILENKLLSEERQCKGTFKLGICIGD